MQCMAALVQSFAWPRAMRLLHANGYGILSLRICSTDSVKGITLKITLERNSEHMKGKLVHHVGYT